MHNTVIQYCDNNNFVKLYNRIRYGMYSVYVFIKSADNFSQFTFHWPLWPVFECINVIN